VGRKKIELDWKLVDNLFSYGATISMVANILEVSHDIIEKRIKEEKDMGPSAYRETKLSKVRVKLIQKAIDQALTGNTTMLIFCLKNLCGWTDKKETSISTAEGKKLIIDMGPNE